MEWKKIASMEYGKIVFHSIPWPAVMFEVGQCSVTSFNLRHTYKTCRVRRDPATDNLSDDTKNAKDNIDPQTKKVCTSETTGLPISAIIACDLQKKKSSDRKPSIICCRY